MYDILDKDIIQSVVKNYEQEENDALRATLAKFEAKEVKALINMVESYVFASPQSLRELVSYTLPAIIDCARAVKTSASDQPFLGVRSRDNQLILEPIDATMFNRVWGQTGKTNFENTITSTGSTDYIGTSDNPESTTEESGYVIIGFLENSPSPKINKALLSKSNEKYPYAGLEFSKCGKMQLAALPQPWIIIPEQSFYIEVYAYKTGTTELEPVGFKVMQAKNTLKL